ncbi:MAG TPA: hypothetical protein VET24_11885 [Actinomycetota bacterium]|nr:hypothetical protein [Actinomycetota bacterium]
MSAPRPAARPVTRQPVAKEPVRRINVDERPHHAAIGHAAHPASAAGGPARWRVIDLTEPTPREYTVPAPSPMRIAGGRRESEARRWGPATHTEAWSSMAAGAEGQGAPRPLPAFFRLDPLQSGSEAGSRAQ